MKLGFTWMTATAGALFLGGWGTTSASEGAQPAAPATSAPAGPGSAACASEVLRWEYDEAARILRLEDGRVRLNCCGHRTTTVERVDGNLLEVTQRDEPDAGGRCATECAYDLSLAVADVRAEETFVRLLRDVTDEGGSPSLLWQGTLDLSRRAGEIALDADRCAAAR